MPDSLPPLAPPLLNPLLRDTGTPPIPEAHAWASRYAGALGPMMDLCQAVPGYPPHPEMLDHLAQAARTPEAARYGLIPGDLALREAYAEHLSSIAGGAVSPAQVAITAGCNQAFFLAMLALAGRGDAVALPVPRYWNHQMTLDMLGIEARMLPCDATEGFVPDPDQAEPVLADPRVRALVLITPNNPTGAVYPPDVLARFHALCRRHGKWLVLDETYRDFLPPGQDRAHGLFAEPDWEDGLVGLYSFSKAYCIPGHRLGAVAAGEALQVQFAKALDCLHICPQRAGQAALAWAIPALGGWRESNRDRINRRAAALRAAFQALPDWRVDSLGAYFAYVRHPFAGVPSSRVAEALTAERGVLCLPGSAFGPGQDEQLRLAFANVEEEHLPDLTARLRDVTVS